MDSTSSYLHPDWDKATTRSMFSNMKPKDVEPVQFKRKMEFWSHCIAVYCETSKTGVVDFPDLRQKFRKDDLFPTPLEAVMIELYKKGELQTEEDITRKNQGWVSWSLSFVNPFGSQEPDVKTQRLIHLPSIMKLAAQLRSFEARLAQEEYEEDEYIIAYTDFRHKALHIIRDETSFRLAINHLIKCGDVTEGCSRSGERILKFKDQRSNSPISFTAADASVHDIRVAMSKLDKEIKRLEERETQLKEDAKEAIRSRNKKQALNIIAKRKRVEKDILNKDKQYQQLMAMLGKIAESRQTKEVLDAYKIGNEAFKSALDRQGLSVESIDKTIDEMHDTMDGFKEINDAISTGFVPADQRMDEDELEAELNELIEADKSAERNNAVRVNKNIINISTLPDVPTTGLPSSSNVSAVDISASLEERMRRLRERA